MKRFLIPTLVVLSLLVAIAITTLFLSERESTISQQAVVPVQKETKAETQLSDLLNVVEESQPSTAPPPLAAKIQLPKHYFQTFNNCGPATLAMVVNYYGIDRTQIELGNELRPYQNAVGDNDDKSVTLRELAVKGEELGLLAYHRPVGSIELLQQLTAQGIPVLTRTWTKVDEDIGHYRVVTGYDDTKKVIIQDDSLQGKDIAIPYSDFLTIWEKFNYEYLVLVETDKKEIAESIIGADTDEQYSWQRAEKYATESLKNDPENIYARFNLSVALYHLGEYQSSVEEYEAVADMLSQRTLWYQLEPLLAYYKLGQYDTVLSHVNSILSNSNRAYSELYFLRGLIYQEQGEGAAATAEFELAKKYNRYFNPSVVGLTAEL